MKQEKTINLDWCTTIPKLEVVRKVACKPLQTEIKAKIELRVYTENEFGVFSAVISQDTIAKRSS